MAESGSFAVGADLLLVVSVEPEHLKCDGVTDDTLKNQVGLHRMQIDHTNGGVEILSSEMLKSIEN